MSVRRFLSRRDKSPAHRFTEHAHKQDTTTKTELQPTHFDGVFIPPKHDSPRKPDKEEEKKIKAIVERLRHYGITNIREANVEYALIVATPKGDAEAAFRLLMTLEDTYEGIIRPYDSNVKMLGAVNREATTCYLDALLFAMFAKLDSFEAMLYENFEDAKRKRLAGLLRLWVNMLRTGRLITTDLTEHIQKALMECGWADAGRIRQQDPSEAFTFITGQLELPMLTLKMDMYHTGKEDPQDDHKFINERLLEVAVVEKPSEGQDVVTLEDCLEHYFNNRIEVKRHLEMQRRNTLKSTSAIDTSEKTEKDSSTHIEVLEVPETPIAQSPAVLTPATEMPPFQSKIEQLRPTFGRKRGDSIFGQRKIELLGIDPNELKREDTTSSVDTKGRKLSTKTEVLMPAWQFFKLLPWYTDHMPTSDAQVAAHFSKKRPVLGICLKRYSYSNSGQARRMDTHIDIPLEIAVPNFVSDDSMQEEGPLMGNFRLALQSVVCHRGVSVHSGHYICLARGRPAAGMGPHSSTGSVLEDDDSDDVEDPWMRFDDLAKERVTYVDIREALRKETPYLLFYQVLPIGEDGRSVHELPSYTEATSRSQSDAATLEKPLLFDPEASDSHIERLATEQAFRNSTEASDFKATSDRTSLDIAGARDTPRGRATATDTEDPRSKSIAFDAASAATISIPTTPSEEKGSSFLSVANKWSGPLRGNRVPPKPAGAVKSRPTSTGPDPSGNRFSLNMSKLTQRMSNSSTRDGKVDTSGSSVEDLPVRPSSELVAGEQTARTSSVAENGAATKEGVQALDMGNAHTNAGAIANANDDDLSATDKHGGTVHHGGKLSKKEKEKDKASNRKELKEGRGKKGEDRDCVVM